MKKRFGMFIVTLGMACSLAVPAEAANVDENIEELYQEYVSVVDELNSQYGMEVSVAPFEEIDTSNMPTVETVRRDAIDLSVMLQNTEAAMEAAVEVQSSSGAGEKSVTGYSSGSWNGGFFMWTVSGTVTVYTAPGTPSYYLSGIKNARVANYSVPAGFYSRAHSNLRYSLSSNMRTYTVWQTYDVGKGAVSASLNPRADFTVNSSTGVVSINAFSA